MLKSIIYADTALVSALSSLLVLQGTQEQVKPRQVREICIAQEVDYSDEDVKAIAHYANGFNGAPALNIGLNKGYHALGAENRQILNEMNPDMDDLSFASLMYSKGKEYVSPFDLVSARTLSAMSLESVRKLLKKAS